MRTTTNRPYESLDVQTINSMLAQVTTALQARDIEAARADGYMPVHIDMPGVIENIITALEAELARRCRHGQTGFCYDEATPEQRAALAMLHRHAYDWAIDHLRDEYDPELYAADYATEHYALPEDEWPSHPAYASEWVERDEEKHVTGWPSPAGHLGR